MTKKKKELMSMIDMKEKNNKQMIIKYVYMNLKKVMMYYGILFNNNKNYKNIKLNLKKKYQQLYYKQINKINRVHRVNLLHRVNQIYKNN